MLVIGGLSGNKIMLSTSSLDSLFPEWHNAPICHTKLVTSTEVVRGGDLRRILRREFCCWLLAGGKGGVR